MYIETYLVVMLKNNESVMDTKGQRHDPNFSPVSHNLLYSSSLSILWGARQTVSPFSSTKQLSLSKAAHGTVTVTRWMKPATTCTGRPMPSRLSLMAYTSRKGITGASWASQLDDYLHIEGNVLNTASTIVKVYCQIIQADFLFQELAQVMLKQVATCSFLQKLRDRKEPWHLYSLLYILLFNFPWFSFN